VLLTTILPQTIGELFDLSDDLISLRTTYVLKGAFLHALLCLEQPLIIGGRYVVSRVHHCARHRRGF